MKKTSLKNHTELFPAARFLLFQLPVAERLELTKEIRKKDWAEGFNQVHKSLSKKIKAKGIKSSDVEGIIENVRKKYARRH